MKTKKASSIPRFGCHSNRLEHDSKTVVYCEQFCDALKSEIRRLRDYCGELESDNAAMEAIVDDYRRLLDVVCKEDAAIMCKNLFKLDYPDAAI